VSVYIISPKRWWRSGSNWIENERRNRDNANINYCRLQTGCDIFDPMVLVCVQVQSIGKRWCCAYNYNSVLRPPVRGNWLCSSSTKHMASMKELVILCPVRKKECHKNAKFLINLDLVAHWNGTSFASPSPFSFLSPLLTFTFNSQIMFSKGDVVLVIGWCKPILSKFC
jgi:hypothetical protein